MATPRYIWIRNLGGATKPMTVRRLTQAGATQAIVRGELCELSGGNMVPLSTDKSMDSVVAIAAEDVVSGEPAGYRDFYIPRPDDVWELDLASGATVQNPDWGAALYVSGSQELTTDAGSNIIGRVATDQHIPKQLSKEFVPPDAGTTRRALPGKVQFCILASVSLYSALQDVA